MYCPYIWKCVLALFYGDIDRTNMREGLCFYSERQCLLWRGGAQTTDSGSQGERACHCLASLCSINACHTWKDNSATWLTFQQGNDQLLPSNPEGKRLFLSSDSSSWKLLFLLPVSFICFWRTQKNWSWIFLSLCVYAETLFSWRALWEVSVWSVRLWGGREKKRWRRRRRSVVVFLSDEEQLFVWRCWFACRAPCWSQRD